MFSLAIEYFRETDGRSKKQATVAVQALALRLIADRLEHREAIPGPMSKPVQNWPSIKEKPALASLLRVGHEGTSRQSRAERRRARGAARQSRRQASRRRFVPSPAISIVR